MNRKNPNEIQLDWNLPSLLEISELCILGLSWAILRRWRRDQTMKAFIGRLMWSDKTPERPTPPELFPFPGDICCCIMACWCWCWWCWWWWWAIKRPGEDCITDMSIIFELRRSARFCFLRNVKPSRCGGKTLWKNWWNISVWGSSAVRVRLRLGLHTPAAHHFGRAGGGKGREATRREWAGYPDAERAPLAGPVDQMNRREEELQQYFRPIVLSAGFLNTGWIGCGALLLLLPVFVPATADRAVPSSLHSGGTRIEKKRRRIITRRKKSLKGFVRLAIRPYWRRSGRNRRSVGEHRISLLCTSLGWRSIYRTAIRMRTHRDIPTFLIAPISTIEYKIIEMSYYLY